MAYEYLALQHFYLQALGKASVYKLKNFYGDMEEDSSVIKRQAVAIRVAYKKRIGVRKLKPERQNKHIERTPISKVATKTVHKNTYL